MKKTEDEAEFIKSKKTKILEFINKNSIYGIFAFVLIAICTIAVLSIPHSPNTDIPDPTKIIDADPKTVAPTVPPTITPTEKPSATVIPAPSEMPENTPVPSRNDEEPAEDVNKENKNKFTLALPLDKKNVITEFSLEKPIYSETLNEWSCHCGIDLACAEDSNVKASANGIVKSVFNDSLYGYTVVIKHSDGYETLYRGLKTVSISNDELVASGQVIGTAMGSIPYEAHMEDHIHFELSKDSVKVNPLSFIK